MDSVLVVDGARVRDCSAWLDGQLALLPFEDRKLFLNKLFAALDSTWVEMNETPRRRTTSLAAFDRMDHAVNRLSSELDEMRREFLAELKAVGR